MGKPKEEKLDFLRNIGALSLTYLRAGNDKTLLEEVLMLHLEAVRDELKRLGLTGDSMPSLPDSKPKRSER